MTDYIDSDLTSAYAHFQSAAAGDHVLLTNGTYNNPTRKSLTKTTSGVVTFAAQNTGGVTITGAPIDLPSNYTIFQGFDLQYTQPTGDFVTISGSNVQFSRNKVNFENGSGSQKWIIVSDNDITIDHNEFFDKTSLDDMILVGGGSAQRLRCKILYNYIHDFYAPGTPAEPIRLGSSVTAYIDFAAEIGWNRFENIDADTEIISAKSSGNNIHHNTLKNCDGAIVLRQAYNCIVTANVCINSGIRIYGSGHTITRNQIIDNTRSGVSRSLVIGSGDVEDLETTPGSGVAGSPGNIIGSNANYARVKNCVISNNIWANGNSTSGDIVELGNDASRLYQPTGNTITSNIIQASTGTLTKAITGTHPASWAANTVTGNILYPTGTAVVGDMPSSGYTNTNPNLKRLTDGSYRCAYFVDTYEVGPFSP